MSDDAPVQAFSFRFTNPVQDSGEPLANILFVQETPSDRDLLTVDATPLDRTTIQLMPPASATPGPTNHHFALTFTLGTLARPDSIRLSDDLASRWVMVHEVQEAARAIGDDVLYFLYKGSSPLTLDANSALSLMLHTIAGGPAGGSRSTVVRFAWRDDRQLVQVTTNRLPPITNLVEYTGLTVLRRRLAAIPPLAAGFVTSDTVLNDGASQSFFQLQIVNTSATAIRLSPTTHDTPTRFTLRFYAGSDTAARADLATTAQINAFQIPGTPAHGPHTGWSTLAKFDVDHSASNTSWTLTPQHTKTTLTPGEAILLPISNLVTGHATGRSAMVIVYQGLPDYDDGELTAYIHKSPLVFSDHKVGIGTVAPGDKLTINTAGTALEPKEYGLTQVSGTVKLSTFVHSKKINTVFGSGAIGTQSNHDLHLFTSGQDKKRVSVLKDGKVGIGTETPGDKFTVSTGTTPSYGVTHTNGTVKLSSYLYASEAGFGTQTNHDLHFFTNSQTNKRISVLKEGKVGIGTETPDDKLTINTAGTAAEPKEYGLTQVSGTVKLSTFVHSKKGFLYPAVGSGAIGTQSNHDFHLFTNGQANKRVSVLKGGNVGIGTESPAERVHIAGGNLRIDGAIKGHGTMDFYPNVDQTPNEDLLRVRNSSGTEVFSIKHDGALYFSKKPFQYNSYTVTGDDSKLNTGYLYSAWVAVLAGFQMEGSNKIAGLRCLPGMVNGSNNWHVACDTIGATDIHVKISVLFIPREFVNVNGAWNLTSTRTDEVGEFEAYDEQVVGTRTGGE